MDSIRDVKPFVRALLTLYYSTSNPRKKVFYLYDTSVNSRILWATPLWIHFPLEWGARILVF